MCLTSIPDLSFHCFAIQLVEGFASIKLELIAAIELLSFGPQSIKLNKINN